MPSDDAANLEIYGAHNFTGPRLSRVCSECGIKEFYSSMEPTQGGSMIDTDIPQTPGDTPVQLANLGLATTDELIQELRTRIEVDYFNGGGGLEYTTVKGRPGGSLNE